MDKLRIEAIDILDRIIIGRVDPHIYAFTTNTVPNYLKIGDTYRPVSQRLNEWKIFFPDLKKEYSKKATINDETYFRDYSIHQFLEYDLDKARVTPYDLSEGVYFSKEFFKETTTIDVDNAINDIINNYNNNTGKYEYYSSENRLPETYHYVRGDSWTLRPNQQEAVNSFMNAVHNGRTNLLMYAVMRFGKSFTSLCCSLEMGAKVVVVVSAKADVKDEWKKTVEQAGNFSDYIFLEANNLASNENIINEHLANDKKVVIFLTLQDLQGNRIKEKHKQVFEEQIDLLIVDETHFGARAESFGKILENSGYEKSDYKNVNKLNDEIIDSNEADKQIKQLNAKVRLHLSGTPYRILMGSEFEKEDIISFVQFTDIVKAQEEWDKNNINKDDVNEWDNPYYGFPQMVRFAFNPNKSSREKMEALKKSGVTFAFSKLFEPVSIKKDTENKHKIFKNEKEILDLLQVIDGSKSDENLLGFLDYDKIKEGKMCRHMVMVLPYCASCDALENLINSKKDTFKNLGEYEIINISGLDASKKYKKPSDIKSKIKECENKNHKTLTLTVNRMLTGSTVEQWDTMLYFKDTSSPQEYDQAIFRLQNQYVRTLSSESGIIKENLKPQTLLVDFDPNRLFRMQEQKSLIYNVNTEENGNSKLKERISEELRISPIIMMNHNKIREVQATNILEAISEYNNQRSVTDEVLDIPVDLSILDDENIRKVIAQQAEFNSKKGLTVTPIDDEEDDLDIEDNEKGKSGDKKERPNKDTESNGKMDVKDDADIKKLESQIKTYYQRLLFFSFLTKDKVSSLDDILRVIEDEENTRLANNLSIDKNVIENISYLMDPFKRSRLDYKIQNISNLAFDESLEPLERAQTSIKKFNRMSESEVITPSKVCDEMVDLLPEDGLKEIVANQDKILDIASKSGEFAVSLYKKLTEEFNFSHEQVKNVIYSIPSSSIAYEFTRRFYEILGLNVENISTNFNCYDLIQVLDESGEIDYIRIDKLIKQNKPFSKITLKDEIKEGENKVKFGAVIGNPPYQESIEGTSDRQIYNHFMEIGYAISDFSVFVSPGKFLFNAGKTPKAWNRKMLNDKHLFVARYEADSSAIFPMIALSSSVVITVRNTKKTYRPIIKFYSDENVRSVVDKVANHENFSSLVSEIFLQTKFNLDVLFKDYPSVKEKIGAEKRLITSILQSGFPFFDSKKTTEDQIKIYGNNTDGKLTYKNIEKKYLDFKNNNLMGWKIILAATNGAAGNLGNQPVNIIGKPRILADNSGFTQTFISIGNFKNKRSVEYLEKYLRTKFTRYLIGSLKATQRLNREVFANVPSQNFGEDSDIDWTKSIDEIDEQLFDKYSLSTEERNHIKNTIKDM